MKTKPILLLLCVAWMLPLGVTLAQESTEAVPVDSPRPVRRHGELVSVFSGDIHIPAHVEQWGTVVSIGGDVVVEGKVRGEVVVIGGNLDMTGSVRGSVVGVLTNLTVHEAEISDQLINVAGTLDRESTYVGGQFVNIGFGEGWMSLAKPFGVLGAMLFWGRMVKLLVVFILILLLSLLVPDRIRTISEATPTRLVPAFFMGLLGYLGLWVVIALLAVTIIGVPLAIFLFIVLKWLGITGMFHFFGQRVGRAVGREMSLLGAVMLGFVPYGLLILLPSAFGVAGLLVAIMIHCMIWLFLEVPAVGLVLLTRMGSPPPQLAAAGKVEPPPAEPTAPVPEPEQAPEPPPSPHAQ
jgi:hypothetical protein